MFLLMQTSNKEKMEYFKTAVLGKIPRTYYIALITTFLFGLLAHGIAFTNFYPNNDSCALEYVAVPFSKDTLVYYASIGKLLSMIEGNYVFVEGVCMPWLSGVIWLMYCSISVWCLSEALNLKSIISICILSGLITTNPITIAINSYSGNVHSQGRTLLYVSLALMFYLKPDMASSKKYLLTSLFLFLTANSCLAYISVFVCFWIIVKVCNLVQKKTDICDEIRKHIAVLLLSGGVIVISYAIDYILVHLVGGERTVENSRLDNATINLRDRFVLNFIECYKNVFRFFKRDLSMSCVYGAVFGVAITITLLLAIKNWGGGKLYNTRVERISLLILIGVDLLILPLAMDFTRLVYPTHALLWFSFITPWIGMLYLSETITRTCHGEQKEIKIFCISVFVVCVITINHWINFSNAVYTMMWANHEAAISTATRVADRIESQEGYVAGQTKVVFIGDVNNNFGKKKKSFEKYDWILDVGEISRNNQFTYGYPFVCCLQNELQMDINCTYPLFLGGYGDDFWSILYEAGVRNSQAEIIGFFDSMDAFPASECIKWYNDEILVVKVGNYK